ncbi:hypothetical protein F0L74_08895 [Chitinophaga agrisoli]|uniref:Ubiquinone biosynthesis protein COQ4 n=1 Tax=Chitinophaga agrisoli TaxID=2607653 RepID=A0A5B2VVE3_9BACT|nr:hypothetical protein [Chitinophaga agrisoli]KAA2242640.1 hypothetical protein F0L74_08895 [Chitinophaga agrisoli]
MNIFQSIARRIIRHSFHLSVWTIEQFYDIAVYEEKTRQLAELPEGTLGKDIANCLQRNGLRIVPGFESHDLKHVLLDYKMTPVDEIRLQAFMLGNGNHTLASFAIFIFGALFLPELWRTFYQDFRDGRHARPISTWSIEDFAHCQTAALREAVFHYAPPAKQPLIDASRIARTGAYTAILLGTFGMLFCLPFLFSSSMEDLVGAGFPFLGGTIIAGSGLIALSNLASGKKKEAARAAVISV